MLISNVESAPRTVAPPPAAPTAPDKGREKLIAQFVADLQRMPIDDVKSLKKLAAYSVTRAEGTAAVRFRPGPQQLIERLRHAHKCKKDPSPRFIQTPAKGRTRQWTCIACNESAITLPPAQSNGKW